MLDILVARALLYNIVLPRYPREVEPRGALEELMSQPEDRSGVDSQDMTEVLKHNHQRPGRGQYI